jgi:hypothetical protein
MESYELKGEGSMTKSMKIENHNNGRDLLLLKESMKKMTRILGLNINITLSKLLHLLPKLWLFVILKY